MNITRENLRQVKEEIFIESITEEELNKIKDRLLREVKEVTDNFNNSNNEGEMVDE